MIKTNYIAYGSNCNLLQMHKRCPDSKVIGTGFINGYELLFRGKIGSAVATIEPNIKVKVPVVLWEISSSDEKKLDIYEGFPFLYKKETLPVQLENGKLLYGMAYLINYGEINRPSEHYYHVIEEGYTDNNLNIACLERALKKCSK